MKKIKTKTIPPTLGITEEFIEDAIRKYQAEALLKKIYETNQLIYSKENSAGAMITRTAYVVKDGILTAINLIITPWDLYDLAYFTILKTHDNRGKKNISDKEFDYLIYLIQNYNNWEIEVEGNDIILLMFGIMGEQFKHREFNTLEHIARENYILFECSKKVESNLDLETEYARKVGIEWRKITAFLVLGLLSNTGDIVLQYKNELTGELIDVRDLIGEYTYTYQQVRKSSLGRQTFYIKPFIKTEMNNLLQVSPFLTRFIVEHCNLWQLRDKFVEEGKKNFPSKFGVFFEQYLKELFEEYIPNDFKRIDEDTTKRADWEIKLGEYDILIEQKSALLRMDVKQQNSNVEGMKDYLKNNVIPAITQLYNTEKIFGDKDYIKIILLYDDYLEGEIIDYVFEDMDECKTENDGYYWLMNIREFEMLIDAYKNDKELFDSIMNEKIKRETNHSNDGKSIKKLFEEKTSYENHYMKNDKFARYQYESIAKDYLEWKS